MLRCRCCCAWALLITAASRPMLAGTNQNASQGSATRRNSSKIHPVIAVLSTVHDSYLFKTQ